MLLWLIFLIMKLLLSPSGKIAACPLNLNGKLLKSIFNGVRDGNGPKVPTCPIRATPNLLGPSVNTTASLWSIKKYFAAARLQRRKTTPAPPIEISTKPICAGSLQEFRSEERRVGKECRSRWWRNE